MIDLGTWLALAERLAVIRAEREKETPLTVTLAFDMNDQARIVPLARQKRRTVVGSAVVPGRTE